MATKPIQLPSGSWQVRVQVDNGSESGKQHYKSFTNPDKKMAVHLAAQYEALRKEQHKPENMTVGEAIDAYIDSHASILSPTTYRAYKANRKNFVLIETIKLCNLRSRHIQELINQLSATRSPKTIRNIYALLTAALRCYHQDFIPRVDLPRRVHVEISIPEKADVSAILAAAQGTPLESAILLAAGYGLRRGEICALLFSDIDDQARTITVNKAMVQAAASREWVIKTPKSYAGTRTLSVSANLIDRLRHNQRPGSDRVCPMTPARVTKKFKILATELGIDTNFHALRHYNASIMLSLSIPDKYQMERLGQSTPGLVKAVYQHIMSDKQKEVADTMNTAFDDMIL